MQSGTVQLDRSRFIAIGVRQGDAFFVQRERKTALVDGGIDIGGFSNQFLRVANRRRVDILVCTHNDADHANGILGFLRDGLSCKEVWLPGSWTDRLEDLIRRPTEFTAELVSNINEVRARTVERPAESTVLESLGWHYMENQQEAKGEEISQGSLVENLGTIIDEESYPDRFWPYSPFWWPRPNNIDLLWSMLAENAKLQLFNEAIRAASRIRDIFLQAYHRGALIRWFEYNSHSSSGGAQNFLVPLNSREIVRLRVGRWTALDYLYLTTVNRESLVFATPVTKGEPAVIFTADSDLSFTQPIHWSDGVIITALHHGSEANVRAYHRFVRETNNDIQAIWVRSDGKFQSRPGKSYLSVRGSRFCTLCRNSSYPKQNVRFSDVMGRWKQNHTRRCRCT